jgi:glutathione S-transferase
MHSSFMNLRSEMPMNCRKQFKDFSISADAQVEVNRIELLWQTCYERYSKPGKWLFGEYSIADAMFAPIALRFFGY